MKYKVLGVNSGLGVSLFPFKNNLIGNIETRGIFHTPGNEQWKANFQDLPLWKKEVTIPMGKDFDVTVIISSPDCGSGSVLRYSRAKKLGDHKKNDSLRQFFKAINFFKPKFFLFENLDGLYKSFPREDFANLLPGYRLVEHLESVSAWGNSQKNRKRLIIVGIRKDTNKMVDKYFKLPDYMRDVKTCKELYGDLKEEDPTIAHVREHIDEVISIHARCKMSLAVIQQHWSNRLKGKKRWVTEPGFKFSTAPGVYRNLHGSFPATARKANRQFDYKGLTLTPRQLARVQGVGDDFILYYDKIKSKYWINKGRTVVTKTPPMEISIWFKNKLHKALTKIKQNDTITK